MSDAGCPMPDAGCHWQRINLKDFWTGISLSLPLTIHE